jgi:hypothetical protein
VSNFIPGHAAITCRPVGVSVFSPAQAVSPEWPARRRRHPPQTSTSALTGGWARLRSFQPGNTKMTIARSRFAAFASAGLARTPQLLSAHQDWEKCRERFSGPDPWRRLGRRKSIIDIACSAKRCVFSVAERRRRRFSGSSRAIGECGPRCPSTVLGEHRAKQARHRGSARECLPPEQVQQ